MELYKYCDIEASNNNTNSSRSNICTNSNIPFYFFNIISFLKAVNHSQCSKTFK